MSKLILSCAGSEEEPSQIPAATNAFSTTILLHCELAWDLNGFPSITFPSITLWASRSSCQHGCNPDQADLTLLAYPSYSSYKLPFLPMTLLATAT
jgi:hypothetical protein